MTKKERQKIYRQAAEDFFLGRKNACYGICHSLLKYNLNSYIIPEGGGGGVGL